MNTQEILERKERYDYDLWMYDRNLNDVMRKFAGMQGDSKYSLG